ncbi:MAG: hypothetical protein WCL18_11025 [bacterium]
MDADNNKFPLLFHTTQNIHSGTTPATTLPSVIVQSVLPIRNVLFIFIKELVKPGITLIVPPPPSTCNFVAGASVPIPTFHEL